MYLGGFKPNQRYDARLPNRRAHDVRLFLDSSVPVCNLFRSKMDQIYLFLATTPQTMLHRENTFCPTKEKMIVEQEVALHFKCCRYLP